MAKSKKKTGSQQLVGLGASALPSPVRNVVASRWGARITLLLLVALAASGILTLDWKDGIPHLHVNKERAAEVQHSLEERVEERIDMAEDEGGAKQWLSDRWKFRKEQQ